MAHDLTPSQTVGPFYWGTLVNAYRCDLAPPGVAGERIEVVLKLHDVEGAIVPHSGHWTTEENPDATVALVTAFLAKK